MDSEKWSISRERSGKGKEVTTIADILQQYWRVNYKKIYPMEFFTLQTHKRFLDQRKEVGYQAQKGAREVNNSETG